RETIRLIGPLVLDGAVLTLYITKFPQPLAKGRDADRSLRRDAMKNADPPNSAGLLCECAAETNSRCAADERDELAPSNVTCHAPLPRRHAQSNNITSLFDHFESVARWPRYVRLAFDIRSISRVVEEVRPRYRQT